MPSQHKHPSIAFRPPADLRAWLLEHVRRTGRARNAVLVDALSMYRKSVENGTVKQSTTTEGDDASGIDTA